MQNVNKVCLFTMRTPQGAFNCIVDWSSAPDYSCCYGFVVRDNDNKAPLNLLNLGEAVQLHAVNMLKCISDCFKLVWMNKY